jgi:hypothetical protein
MLAASLFRSAGLWVRFAIQGIVLPASAFLGTGSST